MKYFKVFLAHVILYLYLCCMEIYRVQHRAFSADVIEKNISPDPNKPKWVVYLCPIGNRFDMVAHEICEYLNYSGLHSPNQDDRPEILKTLNL